MAGDRDTTFDALIPELPHWNNGAGISIDAWIACIGRHDHAIGYSRVFWPEFVLHEGCLLRAGFSKESFDGFMEQCGGNRRAVEVVMNHEHVANVLMGLQNEGLRPTREQILYLGRVLRDMWQARLRRDFPQLDIVLSFPEEHQDDLDAYEITVFQVERDNARKTDIDPRAIQVTVGEDELTVGLADGRRVTAPLAWFPRLLHADPAHRRNWRLLANGEGIHWPDVDEDLSVAGLLRGASGRAGPRR
jgi:hypothetical protein